MSTEPDNVTPLPATRRKDRLAPTAPEHVEDLNNNTTEEIETDPRKRRADVLRAKIITGADLHNIPKPVPLVDSLLFAETTSMIYGPPGCGKSFLTIGLACSVITGRDWQGVPTYGNGLPVVYLAGEGMRGVMRRVAAWCAHNGENLDTVTRGLHILPGGLALQSDVDRWAIVEVIEEIGPCLVIVDTLHRHAYGADENSSKDMGKVLEALDAIAQGPTKPHAAMVHHSGKNAQNGARGSSALLGAVDTELKISGEPPQGQVTVTKQKDIEAREPWWVRYERAGVDPETGGHLSLVAVAMGSVPPMSSERVDRYVEILGEITDERGTTVKDWRAAVVEETDPEGTGKGLSLPAFQKVVKALRDSGQVENVARGDKTFRYVPVSQEPPTLGLDD